MLVGACVSGGGGGGGEGGAVSLTLEIRLKEQYPVTVQNPTLIFWQDVVNSKDARPSSIQQLYTKNSQNYRSMI